MGARNGSTRHHDEPELHEIRVGGHLDKRWADSVGGLTFRHERDGTTTLMGALADQAALHGLLGRMRDLNVPIVSVRRVDAGGERDQQRGAAPAADAREGSGQAFANRASARLIGALFLAAFVLYGGGNALAMSVAGAADVLSAVSAHQTRLALGAFLMVLDAVAVVGLGALFFPILERCGKRTALAYLAARIVEGVFLAAGVLGLLVLLPSGQQGAGGAAASLGPAALAPLALQWNAMAYQLAMLSLGLGSVFAWTLLFRAQLLPRWLSAWGVLGYAIFLAGAIAELFGLHVGVMFAIPGGLFELALGVWLLVKGFQPGVRAQPGVH